MMSSLRDALASRLKREEAMTPYAFALAETSDIPQLCALNARVVSSLPEWGMFMRQETDFFARIFNCGGAVIIARANGELAGYSVTALTSATFPAFAREPRVTGLLFGTAIARFARGHGLQNRLIDLRCDALWACGCEAVQATVAPTNHRSLENLLEADFEVMALRSLLDGHPRFIVQRTVDTPVNKSHTGANPVILPPAGALSDHDTLLANGARGTGMMHAPDPALLYRTVP